MLQVNEAGDNDIVIVDDDNISPDFENIGDEVNAEVYQLDETDQDEQTLPGQACYLKSKK